MGSSNFVQKHFVSDACSSDAGASDRWGCRLVAAPMMGRTDAVGCAYLRQVLPRALLFTEMIHSAALVHGGALARARLQEYFDWQEALPSGTARGEGGGIVLQLGGSDPALLGKASAIARDYPFCEINLNLGCPSPRVTKGGFGACLMKSPSLAASLVGAMKEATGEAGVLVSVKTRIGVDEQDDETRLHTLVDALCAAGCDRLYVHARKAWLKGVSAKENRNLPPLKPQVARRLQEARPSLPVFYNGGIQNIREAEAFRTPFAGVMVGRALWRSPCLFACKTEAERPLWREQIAEDTLSAIDRALSFSRSTPRPFSRLSRRLAFRGAARLSRRAMSLYHGEPNAGDWRRRLQRAFEGLKVAEKTGLDSFPQQGYNPGE